MISFFILPIHNKEFLLEKVLHGILSSCNSDFHIVAILDGCTDNSEIVLKDFLHKHKLSDKTTTVKMPDVHEITCLNYGLTCVRLMNPAQDSLVFTVQDDVVLQEPNIDDKMRYLFNCETNLGDVSMRLGCDLIYSPQQDLFFEQNLVESEFGHWKPMGLKHYTVVNHGDLIKKQIAISSPTCTLWSRYFNVGFYDASLAPVGWHCHDFSLRLMQYGYQNVVYALKYQSDFSWGSMHTVSGNKVNQQHELLYQENIQFLCRKYRNLLQIPRG